MFDAAAAVSTESSANVVLLGGCSKTEHKAIQSEREKGGGVESKKKTISSPFCHDCPLTRAATANSCFVVSGLTLLCVCYSGGQIGN